MTNCNLYYLLWSAAKHQEVSGQQLGKMVGRQVKIFQQAAVSPKTSDIVVQMHNPSGEGIFLDGEGII